MKSLLAAFAIASAFLLSSCALPETISASAAGGIDITNPTVVNDLIDAKFNVDEAARIGILDANDPAPYCLADVLKRAGIGGPELESFKPKYGGVASAGAVLYIEKRKLEKLRGGVKIDPSCLALVGQIVFDGASSARKAVTPSITGLLR
jgi:hypothetical protein